MGALAIARKAFSIDGPVYHSKIITYDLSGDAALRLGTKKPHTKISVRLDSRVWTAGF